MFIVRTLICLFVLQVAIAFASSFNPFHGFTKWISGKPIITNEFRKIDKSVAIMKEARDLMPGGVNSPVRAFSSVGGTPIVFDRVKGSHIWDVDNNEYIDYVGSWGTGIVGHANEHDIK